jgi:hypothetical protein
MCMDNNYYVYYDIVHVSVLIITCILQGSRSVIDIIMGEIRSANIIILY